MYKKNEEERNEIKIIIIGNSGVGKTNLVNAVIGLEFQENDIPTITQTNSWVTAYRKCTSW